MPRTVSVTDKPTETTWGTTMTYSVPSFPLPLVVYKLTDNAKPIDRIEYLKGKQEGLRRVSRYHADKTIAEKFIATAEGIKEGEYESFSPGSDKTQGYTEIGKHESGVPSGHRHVVTWTTDASGVVCQTEHEQEFGTKDKAGQKVGHWLSTRNGKKADEMFFRSELPEAGFRIEYDKYGVPNCYYAICGRYQIEKSLKNGKDHYVASVLDVPGGAEPDKDRRSDDTFTQQRMQALYADSIVFMELTRFEEIKKAFAPIYAEHMPEQENFASYQKNKIEIEVKKPVAEAQVNRRFNTWRDLTR